MIALAGCGGGSPVTTTTSRGEPAPAETPQGHVGDGVGGVSLEKLGDFDQPLYVTQPPGDSAHLFVVEQTGRVRCSRTGRGRTRRFSTWRTRSHAAANRGCCRSPSLRTTRRAG